MTPSTEIAELIRQAIDQGHTVIIPTPAGKAGTTPMTSSSLAMTFRLLFDLAPAEARAFAVLLAHEHASRQALHVAIARSDTPTTDSRGVDVIICKLRRKLAAHKIAINVIWALGYAIDRKDRDRVHGIIANHDAGAMSPRPKSEDPEININPTSP